MGVPTKKPPLSFQLDKFTGQNMKQIALLNDATLPVKYQDWFYSEMLERLEYSRMCYHSDVVIGGITCKVDELKDVLLFT